MAAAQVQVTGVIGPDGALRIPAEILEQANLAVGTPVLVTLLEDGTLAIHRDDPNSDEAWEKRWERLNPEAEADIAAGRFTTYFSEDEFEAALQAHSKTQ